MIRAESSLNTTVVRIALLVSSLNTACAGSSSMDGSGGASGNGGTSTGGATASGGVTSAGGSTGANGGATSVGTAGSSASGAGGTIASNGGATSVGAAGSSVSGAGGTIASNGGATSGSGGAGGAGGASKSAGGAPGGSTASCYVGPTVTQQNTDYVARKWARWPVATPPSMRLPNPMKFTDLGNGTVRDEVTGLIWQQTSDGTTRTWADAIANCAGLTLDGGGWTLPTRIELTSIVDAAQPSGARVNATYFKFAAKAGWTWASTPWVVDSRKTVTPPLSWFINFAVGDSNNSLDQTAASAYDRCVKVPTEQTLPAAHYASVSGEVMDNYTCLTWQQDGSDPMPTLSWDQAVSYCQSLSLNGHSWHLPTLNELASVVDDVPSGDVSPAVDHTAFPNTAAGAWYWTTTPYGSSTTEQWSLNFKDGFTKHQAKSVLGIARCVR